MRASRAISPNLAASFHQTQNNKQTTATTTTNKAQTGAGLKVNMMLSPSMVGVLSRYVNSTFNDCPSGVPDSVTNALAGAPYLDTAREGRVRAATTVSQAAEGFAPTHARLSTYRFVSVGKKWLLSV